MKKNTIKAFTLVEMLIVIVIIGILIAALLPRMNAAQGRARDVARKTALSQIQSAIVTYQGDYGKWPYSGNYDDDTLPAIGLEKIRDKLINAGMTDVPTDPLGGNVKGLDNASFSTTSGEYGYMISTRNGTTKAGFVLMAKTEVAGGSNWVVCDNGGIISGGVDLKNIQPCTSVEKGDECVPSSEGNSKCTFKNEDQLRYIVLY